MFKPLKNHLQVVGFTFHANGVVI